MSRFLVVNTMLGEVLVVSSALLLSLTKTGSPYSEPTQTQYPRYKFEAVICKFKNQFRLNKPIDSQAEIYKRSVERPGSKEKSKL